MSHLTHGKNSAFAQVSEIDIASQKFIDTYNARATFFSDAFVKKIQKRDRRALAELTKHALPPTQMDLRAQLNKCLEAGMMDDHTLTMNDGKIYAIQQLKLLVPNWAVLAEKALMESDAALADRLMSSVHWNAKSAFEVTFVTAVNELKEIRKSKQSPSPFEHYLTWITNPLEKAIEHVKEVNPPANALVGYGKRISLKDAIKEAESLKEAFRKALAKK